MKWFEVARLVTMRAQIVLLCITCIFVTGILTIPFYGFSPTEKKELPKQITEADIKRWGQEPIPVKVGLSITDFITFENIKNKFTLDALVWFEFDPALVPLEKINDFSFESAQIIKKSKPVIRKQGNQTIAHYYIRVEFNEYLNHSRFPLDDHYLQLDLYNNAFYAREIAFIAEPKDFVFSPQAAISGWEIVDKKVQAGYEEIAVVLGDKIEHPQAIFYISLNKQNIKQILLIFLPLLFIFFFCVLSFSLASVLAIPMTLAGISGLLAYMFVINNLSPFVGYLMLSDYFVLLFLCEVFLIFVVNMFCLSQDHRLSKSTLDRIKGAVILCLYVLLYCALYYLLIIKK